MARRILILKGSPRAGGNSAALADRVADGAREAGAEVEAVFLHDLDIRPCDACDNCIETGGVCIIKDDMQSIYQKLLSADAIVLASPVYWFTISAQLKACIDRWYGLQTAGWKQLAGKQVGVVLSYGDTDLYSSGGINAIHTIESMCRFLRMEIVGIVHGTLMDVGDAAKHPEFMEQACQLGRHLGAGKDKNDSH
ncbi:MAG: flavodoxin family protein [Chloroflexi bacterium]|nr:flavodoxin family protein [Chloroflexota bacterium]